MLHCVFVSGFRITCRNLTATAKSKAKVQRRSVTAKRRQSLQATSHVRWPWRGRVLACCSVAASTVPCWPRWPIGTCPKANRLTLSTSLSQVGHCTVSNFKKHCFVVRVVLAFVDTLHRQLNEFRIGSRGSRPRYGAQRTGRAQVRCVFFLRCSTSDHVMCWSVQTIGTPSSMAFD